MIFQDPFACLHPMYRVGDQIAEAVQRARRRLAARPPGRGRSSCSAPSGSRTPTVRARDYPHQFSGGMRQRAMIAMALVHNPDVLIADEPTTALDVTVQAQILELIDRVKKEFDVGVILITHDLGVVAETASHVLVMYGGPRDGVRPRGGDLRRAPSTRMPGACSSRCRRSSGAWRRSSRSRARRRRCCTRRPGCPFHPRCRYRFDRCDQGRAAPRADARAVTSTPASCPPSGSASEWQRRVAAALGRRLVSSGRPSIGQATGRSSSSST